MLKEMGLGYWLLFQRSSRRPDMAAMGTPDTQTGNELLTVKEQLSQTSEKAGGVQWEC